MQTYRFVQRYNCKHNKRHDDLTSQDLLSIPWPVNALQLCYMEEICSYIRSNFESVMFCVPMKNSVFYFVPLRSTLGNMKFLILIQYFNQSVCVILYYETDFMGISRRDWGPRPSYLAIVLNCFKCKGVWGGGANQVQCQK